MFFSTPCGTQFEIPDDWWHFAEMQVFSPSGGGYFPYSPDAVGVQVVPCSLVEPPRRANGVPAFKKFKLLPVLFALQSPECALPPITVVDSPGGGYRYRVTNGYHRYYASVAAGYQGIPVLVQPAPIG